MKIRFRVLSGRQALLLLAAFFLISALVVLSAIWFPAAIRTIIPKDNAKLPINCTDRPQGVVSMTFDVSLSGESLGKLCDVLTKNNVTATFFITGEIAERRADSVWALSGAGQEIMCASDQRLGMLSLKRQETVNRINRGCDKIQAVTGNCPTLFRPSDGQYDAALLETVKMLKMFSIGCDVDSFDIKGLDKEGIVKRVVSKAASGSIIRFNADGKHTLEALPEIIVKLKEKEYSFIPVSAMIYTDDYAINYEGRQILLSYKGGK